MAAAQSPVVPPYRPANDIEYRLAAVRGDATAYLRVLRSAMLYLPVAGEAEADRGQPVYRHDGVSHLAVFTSLQTMRLRVAGVAGAYRVTDCDQLLAASPDLTVRLAVNPGTPIGAYLPMAALQDLAVGRPDLVEFDAAWTFQPANPLEQVMYLARNVASPQRFLDALVVSRAFMPTAGAADPADIATARFPWLVDLRGPSPVINVFTSAQRMAEAGYPAKDSVCLDFIAIVQAWPDQTFWLSVNPGSAIATLFSGQQVVRLTDWARDLVRRRAGRAPGPAGPASPAGPAGPEGMAAW